MSKTILVIDDSETSLFLLQTILDENDDLEYILQGNSIQALETIQTRQVDLVFLDLMMPEMNGFEFLENLKADPHLKNIPVIVLTAMQDKASEEKAVKMGALDYMKKPLDVNELEDKIWRYLFKNVKPKQ